MTEDPSRFAAGLCNDWNVTVSYEQLRMSQFHNLFRKVVGEKDAAPVEPVEDRLESIDKSYSLKKFPAFG